MKNLQADGHAHGNQTSLHGPEQSVTHMKMSQSMPSASLLFSRPLGGALRVLFSLFEPGACNHR